jgi:hypothetical protein
MNEAVVREKLLEICDALAASAQTPSGPADVDMVTFEKAKTVEDALDRLRLQVKCLLFDRDACRRENRYLRQMLDARPHQPKRDTHDDDANAGWL